MSGWKPTVHVLLVTMVRSVQVSHKVIAKKLEVQIKKQHLFQTLTQRNTVLLCQQIEWKYPDKETQFRSFQLERQKKVIVDILSENVVKYLESHS